MNRAAVEDALERDARLPARRVEEVDEVLGREVAGRAGRVRAATGPAGRRVEAADPGVEPGRDVGQRRPARVVEVVGDPFERDAGRDGQPGQRRDLARHADPDRVAEADLVDAELEQPERDLDRSGGLDAAGVRAAEGGRDVAAPPPAELAGARQDRRERRQRLVDASSRCWRGVNASVAAVKTAMASTPAASARSMPALVRDEDRVADAGVRGRGRRSSASASASCGMARGATKLVASISRRPASASSSMNRAFVAVGIGVASFWRPSRGPTS